MTAILHHVTSITAQEFLGSSYINLGLIATFLFEHSAWHLELPTSELAHTC